MLLILLIKQIFYKEERYRKSLEKEIKSQAKLLDYRLYHDSLTALPNRNQLIKDLSKPEKLLLTLVNIDEFRHINDLYGEDSGDEVLISLAGFLKEFAKKHKALAYKLHADEFALIFKDISTKELSIIASELTSEVSQLVVITDDNFVINMGVTIGAAMDESELLTHADMALKQAKKNKLSYLLYEESLEIKEEYERNIEWARKIKKAIKNEKIVPYYQAIFNTDGKSIASVEVLMRMIDENAEAISPILFLDIAKKNKLYPQLTKIIIQKSFKELALINIDFSINLSIIDIVNQKTFKFILDQIDKFPDPRRITFEILESEGVENYEEILNFVKIVKSYGCNIAIDDFGSGYSNFAHILNLKIDLLKLDASLIKDIDSNKSALVTIKAIDSFAKTLGIKTCAEFIHSKEVYETLKELKIDFMQGYYFAEPIPLKELKKSFPLV
jgi:diguanylate cyclase (GGDEF)-like protein